MDVPNNGNVRSFIGRITSEVAIIIHFKSAVGVVGGSEY